MKTFLRLFFTFLLSFLKTIAEDTRDAEDVSILLRSLKMSPTMLQKSQDNRRGNASEIYYYRSQNFLSKNSENKDVKACKKCGYINKPGGTHMVNTGHFVEPAFKYPWIVAIQRDGKTFCGGSLINDRYILTAAHCLKSEGGGKSNFDNTVKYVEPNEITVAFLTQSEKLRSGPKIEKIFPHERFSMETLMHDIGLIKLTSKVSCDRYRNPICLPSPNQAVHHGKEFKIAGWGTDEPGSKKMSHKLQEAVITDIEFEKCEKDFPSNIESLKSHYYCLIGNEGQTPCHGDSGGPSFTKVKGKYYVYGLSSMHASEDCKPNHPFTYTSVSKHIDWINSKMRGKSLASSVSSASSESSASSGSSSGDKPANGPKPVSDNQLSAPRSSQGQKPGCRKRREKKKIPQIS